jgi:hypothetical protein
MLGGIAAGIIVDMETAMTDPQGFYTTVLSAGAILTGFAGTFLQFRIQREASYYRQLAVSFEQGKAKDVYIGLTHFTPAFLLITLSALMSVTFGFVLPLLALAEMAPRFVTPRVVAVGLLSALWPLLGYFLAELIHYRILSNRLATDLFELRREWISLVIGVGGAVLSWLWFLI